MHGSIRQRSIGSYELRVFTGTDPATGKRCYRSKTVLGNRAEAERELAIMVVIVGARSQRRVQNDGWRPARAMVHPKRSLART
jgi:hypothetical protein